MSENSNKLIDSIDGMFAKKDIDTQQKIVEELLSDSNLDRKTELSKPITWSCLTVIEDYLTDKKLPISASILHRFTITSFKYLISKERKSREEYIKALNSLTTIGQTLNSQTNAQKLMER